MTRLFGAVLAVGMLCTPLMAQDYKIGDLQIRHPYVSVAGKAAIAAAGYFQIVNHGDQPDRLVEVTTVAAMAMIHQSAVDTDGVASMAAMPDGVSIPAGETVTLEPGGLHVMFTGLASPLKITKGSPGRAA